MSDYYKTKYLNLRCPFPFPLALLSLREDSPVGNPHVTLHEPLELLSLEKLLHRVVQAEMTADVLICCKSIFSCFQKLDGVLDKYQSLWFPFDVKPAMIKVTTNLCDILTLKIKSNLGM